MSSESTDKIKALLNWSVQQCAGYDNVEIKNFTTSWKNGLAFCAILHRYAPDQIDFYNLKPENIFENCELAFNVAEKHFGIPSLLCPKDMVIMKSPDRLCIITYLSQYYNTLAGQKPKAKMDEHVLLSSIENVPMISKAKEEKNTGLEETENNPSQIEERSENQTCAICLETIYFLEKLNVGDIYYHRSCYRQNQLTNLKIRNKTLERQPLPVNDQINESNKNEVEILSESKKPPSLSNLSPPSNSPIITPKPVLSPSMDSSVIDKTIVDTSQSKSIHNSEDHSSQSASSINIISINASSEESLSKNISDLPLKVDKSENTVSNQLRPSSLDNSISSLNSSFSKKRPAPPPPVSVKPKYDKTKFTLTNKSKKNNKKDIEYPEQLNPFATNDKVSATNTDTEKEQSYNPFEEYMSNENLHPDDKAEKNHKRPAPRLPRKFSDGSITTKSKSDARCDTTGIKIVHSSQAPPILKKIEPDLSSSFSQGSPVVLSEQSNVNKNTDYDKRNSATSSPAKSDFLSHGRTEIQHCFGEIKSDYNLSSSENIINSNSSSPEKSIGPSKKVNTSDQSSVKKIIENMDKIRINIDSQTSDLNVNKKLTLHKLNEKCKSHESLSHSKSSVNKPPAPSRPPPPKREVRGDTSYEFIPYDSLYFQLQELNEKQSQVEAQGRQLQNSLWEVDQNGGKFEEMLQTWLDLVKMKNDLYVKERKLHEILKRQELEDRHSDLEYELRLLMGKQESQKTAAEKAREEELLTQILDTVNARAQLVDQVDEEISNKSSTNEIQKSKVRSIKNLFSIRRRSSSVGKVHSKTFKFGKKKKQSETFVVH